MKSEGKKEIETIAEKNRTIDAIITALDTREDFLVVGHKNPDEDCIASMVAFALLVSKFNKKASVVTCAKVHEQFGYLLNICRYNAIGVIGDCTGLPAFVSTMAVLDTPKPSMLEDAEALTELLEDARVIKIEIDHHLEADSRYVGDPGYRLVTGASSSCELVGLLALKMARRGDLMSRYQISDLFSRNLVLAILTGIIGDSKMGKYLKTRREKWFYARFSTMFDTMLAQKTIKDSRNYATKEQVFDAVTTLSIEEEICYRFMIDHRTDTGPLSYIALNVEDSAHLHNSFAADTVVSVSKAVADVLAEDCGFVSLVAYHDDPRASDFIQFRMRRSHAFQSIDLRAVLKELSVTNGGGHPGAVGFRFHRSEIVDIRACIEDIAARTAQIVRALVRRG